MKLGKTKIIFSVLCLIAALTLAIFTVYAWFVTFKDVKTNGIDAVITSGDVISFEIDYYYAKSEDGTEFKIGDKINKGTNDTLFKMPEYAIRTGDNGPTATAVLMDMKIKFSKSGNFDITAKTARDVVYSDTFKEFTEDNCLSNVVFMRYVEDLMRYVEDLEKDTFANSLTGHDFTIVNDPESDGYIEEDKFITDNFDGNNDEDKKISSIQLLTYTVAENETGKNYVHHIYYVMDYLSTQMNSMYFTMLQIFPNDATLNTQITFNPDLIFEITNSEN